MVEEEAVPVEEVSKPQHAASRKRSAAWCHDAGVGKEASVEEAPRSKRAASGKKAAVVEEEETSLVEAASTRDIQLLLTTRY